MTSKMIEIADSADMIVDGYAFTLDEAGGRVIDLNNAENAMVINKDDQVIETSMNDIEMSIVMGIYERNKEFIER